MTVSGFLIRLFDGPPWRILSSFLRRPVSNLFVAAAKVVSPHRTKVSDERRGVPAFAATVSFLSAVSSSACATLPADLRVPTSFEDDRVSVVVQDAGQRPLRFYTDSGGGWNKIPASTAKQLALPTIGIAKSDDGSVSAPLVTFPAVLASNGVPAPLAEPVLKGGLAVVPDVPMGTDGLLGSRWFAGRIWEFDYPGHSLRALRAAKPVDRSHRADLGFRHDAHGKRDLDFPRLTVTVDGEPLEMLLDTGATATVAQEAAASLHVPAGTQIATSFITRSVFDRWSLRHPEWPVLTSGDQLGRNVFSMIRVPAISIAGLTVGPAWFTQRPDSNFHDWMSSMTDRPIEGAIGGSVFHYVRMTIDYPAAMAYFEIAPVAAIHP